MNISSTEILVVLIVALIVLGPQRLPGAMKSAGKAYRDFKKMSTTVQKEINQVVNDTTSMITDTAETFTGEPLRNGPPGSPGNRWSPTSPSSVRTNSTYRPADEIPADEPPERGSVDEAVGPDPAAADEES
jgi:sec-independent protein translocase protein TatB